MKGNRGSCLLILLILFLIGQLKALEAIFIKPISSLCSKQLSIYGLDDLEHYYDHEPLSGDNLQFDCMRSMQALFNEWCHVMHWDKNTHEVAVQFPHFLVEKRGKLEPITFWTLDDNLHMVDSVKNEQFLHASFPDPVSYHDVGTLRNRNHIVLIDPFYDLKNDMTYSIGTRFVRLPECDTDGAFAISCYDPKHGTVVQRAIPKQYAVVCDKHQSDQERRTMFLQLLKRWASQKNKKIIPYVWGGNSCIDMIDDKGFDKVKGAFHGQEIQYWQRPNMQPPYYGFDCSGLVLRVAHICGIPYWFKTTKTALHYGTEIKSYNDLQSGDLLVWDGHIVVVSDKEKALLIESAGYGTGYGSLHEVRLHKRFGNVRSYKDLFELKNKQKELVTLCKNGAIYRKLAEFKFISLMG